MTRFVERGLMSRYFAAIYLPFVKLCIGVQDDGASIDRIMQYTCNTLNIQIYFFNLYISLFFILYNDKKNAQLIDKLLYCCYMSRQYCFILRELVVSILPSYTSMSNAVRGNRI